MGEPKWVFSLGEGGWFYLGVELGEYYTWGFCNLVDNSGMCIRPIGGLSARR